MIDKRAEGFIPTCELLPQHPEILERFQDWDSCEEIGCADPENGCVYGDCFDCDHFWVKLAGPQRTEPLDLRDEGFVPVTERPWGTEILEVRRDANSCVLCGCHDPKTNTASYDCSKCRYVWVTFRA